MKDNSFLKFFKGDEISALKVILLLYITYRNDNVLKNDLKVFVDNFNIDIIFHKWILLVKNIKYMLIAEVYGNKLTPLTKMIVLNELVDTFIKKHKKIIDKTI